MKKNLFIYYLFKKINKNPSILYWIIYISLSRIGENVRIIRRVCIELSQANSFPSILLVNRNFRVQIEWCANIFQNIILCTQS